MISQMIIYNKLRFACKQPLVILANLLTFRNNNQALINPFVLATAVSKQYI